MKFHGLKTMKDGLMQDFLQIQQYKLVVESLKLKANWNSLRNEQYVT